MGIALRSNIWVHQSCLRTTLEQQCALGSEYRDAGRLGNGADDHGPRYNPPGYVLRLDGRYCCDTGNYRDIVGRVFCVFGASVRITLIFFILSTFLSACGSEARQPLVLDGDPENGRLLLRQFSCGSCHVIPGVAAANGKVGPPLKGISSQVYLAGVLPNTPENMAFFIRSPQKVDPRTAMPDMGITEAHARDMVAYLSQLK
jgi:cytochrome c2